MMFDIFLILCLLITDSRVLFTVAVCQVGSKVTSRPYSNSIVNRTVSGPILSSITAINERACELECHLAIPNLCYMFNYYPESKVCELLYKNRPSDYKVEEKAGAIFKTRKCEENPCFNGGQCYAISSQENKRCICSLFHNGTFCQDFVDRGVQVNTAPVCIGNRGNAFGKVFAPFEGKVKTLRLVYISGEGLSIGPSYTPHNWGGHSPRKNEIQLIVSDKNNKRLIPPEGFALRSEAKVIYESFGFAFDDKELVFPVLSPPFEVEKGAEIRIWFGQDYTGFREYTNRGKTCADVYILYEK